MIQGNSHLPAPPPLPQGSLTITFEVVFPTTITPPRPPSANPHPRPRNPPFAPRRPVIPRATGVWPRSRRRASGGCWGLPPSPHPPFPPSYQAPPSVPSPRPLLVHDHRTATRRPSVRPLHRCHPPRWVQRVPRRATPTHPAARERTRLYNVSGRAHQSSNGNPVTTTMAESSSKIQIKNPKSNGAALSSAGSPVP